METVFELPVASLLKVVKNWRNHCWTITKRRAALIDELYQKQTDNPLIIRVPTLKQ
jgi:hypothetical protein